jgi:hypothetical protein
MKPVWIAAAVAVAVAVLLIVSSVAAFAGWLAPSALLALLSGLTFCG